jgi:ABC-type phosphonate transport system ATPase subunit
MTTNEARPAATGNTPDAPPSTRAQETRQEDESSVGARDAVAESTRGEAAPQGEARSDTTHVDSVEGDALIAHDRCVDYRSRWGVVQGDFIDEPRKAVTDADALVGEILDDLSETFRGQRRSLEQQWEDDESTTEDMRIALRRYRTFFDRLLSL